MMGLCVNSYIDAHDDEEYQRHRANAFTMDLGDICVPKTDFNMPVDEGTPGMEMDDDEPTPSANLDAIVQSLDVIPLRILAPTAHPSDPQGTPGGYTESSAGTTHDVGPAQIFGAKVWRSRRGTIVPQGPPVQVVARYPPARWGPPRALAVAREHPLHRRQPNQERPQPPWATSFSLTLGRR
jgi:hypothetical protein